MTTSSVSPASGARAGGIMVRRFFGLIGLVMACGLGMPALAAAQTTYTDRGLWAAAAGPVNTETFEGIAPPAGYEAFDTNLGLGRPGTRFTGVVRSGASYYLRVVDSAYSGSGFNWGSGAILHGPPVPVGPQGEGGPNSWLLAATPVGTTAIGTDLMSFAQYGSSITITVTLLNAQQFTYTVSTPAYPQRAFFGFVGPSQIFSVRFAGNQGFPVIDNFSFGGPASIGPATITNVTTVGSTVGIYWQPPVSSGQPISGYQLEVAATSFGTAHTVVPTTSTSFVAAGVPNGTYYVRVRTFSGSTAGPGSNERVVTVGPCGGAPGTPTGVTASAQGLLVSASWGPPAGGCAPSSYVIRVGTTPTGADIGTFSVGAATGASGNLPAGTYYVSVQALNGASAGAFSTPVSVTVSNTCAVPAAPGNLVATSALDIVTVTWSAPAGAVTRYLVEVGSSTGASDVGTFPFGVPGFQAPGVARGTYYLRVRAENACGVGPASAERAVTVTY